MIDAGAQALKSRGDGVAAPRHVLVIDDDPVFRAVAEGIICSTGDHTVSFADDGAAGLTVLQRADPPVDSIVLDLNMPRLDGLAFLRQLSATGFTGGVVISSGEVGAVIDAARHLGEMLGLRIAGALPKPLTAQAVRDVLDLEPAGDEAPSGGNSNDRLTLEGATLIPYYQPKFDLTDGSVVGAEALLRVETLDGVVHGPAFLFDRLADRAAVWLATVQIMERVFADMHAWSKSGVSIPVAINLDATVLEDVRAVPTLLGLIAKHGVSAASVTLEMTETSLPSDLTRIVETLARLRMAGFGLSLDDFGTGGANFELFRLCPFSELKVDQTIVRSADADPLSRRFIAFCVASAAERGVTVVAEGIETEAQRDMVLSMRIRIAQGFLLARPMRAAGIETFLSEGSEKFADSLQSAVGA